MQPLTHTLAGAAAHTPLQEQLLAANNAITDVPASLLQCAALRRLDLHCNRLSTLPLALFRLPNLKVSAYMQISM
jgi:Leucine-rich repeat (LRR) protein